MQLEDLNFSPPTTFDKKQSKSTSKLKTTKPKVKKVKSKTKKKKNKNPPTPIIKIGEVPFEEVRALVHQYKFQSVDEWKKYASLPKKQKRYKCSDGVFRPTKPSFIPTNPKSYYDKIGEWTSWEDFLNIYIEPKQPRVMSYEEAKAIIHPLGLRNEYDWYDWWEVNKPPRINKKPSWYVKNKTWVSWGDFLGTNNIAVSKTKELWYNVMSARKLVHAQNFTTQEQFYEWHKHLPDRKLIPKAPYIGYKHAWFGWPDFLGKTLYSKMQIFTVDISVLYILKPINTPDNIYTISIEKQGELEVINKAATNMSRVIQIYQFNQNQSSEMKSIMQMHCTYWWEGYSNMYVVQNIHLLLSVLNTVFNKVYLQPTTIQKIKELHRFISSVDIRR